MVIFYFFKSGFRHAFRIGSRVGVRRRRVRRVRVRRRATNTRDYLERREAARALVVERLNYFQAKYSEIDPAYTQALKFSRIAIRNQRSRWGSCSSNRILNFNYRILDLEPNLRDYIIVHELCHLKELNHGKSFWDLVSLMIPNARELNHIARNIRPQSICNRRALGTVV